MRGEFSIVIVYLSATDHMVPAVDVQDMLIILLSLVNFNRLTAAASKYVCHIVFVIVV